MVRRNLHKIDANGKVLGRLASEIAILLHGKHKVEYQPNKDIGDIVEVTNYDKVKVTGNNKSGVSGAREHIESIVNTPKVAKIEYKVGDKYPGIVKKIVDFGAFIGLPDGTDGLLHISKISDKRVEKVSDVLSEGEEISVEILEFKGNKISLGRA